MTDRSDNFPPQHAPPDGFAGLDALAARAHDLAHARLPEGAERLGRERLLLTAAFMRPSGTAASHAIRAGVRSMLPVLAATAIAAGALLAGLRWFAVDRHAPLTYELDTPQPLAANYLIAPNAAKASAQFSDGSRIIAAPSARLRIDSTESRGARVLLEQGFARVHVQHRGDSRWEFVAGPFDVHVTGTTFTLAWDAPSQAIDLTLIEGAVEVESPLGASHIVVRGGQRFRASLIAGTMQLESADGSQAPQVVTAATAATAANAVNAPSTPQPTAAASKPHPAARHAAASDWTELVRAGSFEAVIDAANTIGLAPTLARGSAEDVRALADAARYTERHALALRTLMVLRTRFPGSHQAAAAGFLLGRTYEGAGEQQQALRYYTRYLRESASGEYAAEALAGQIRTTAALSGPGAARPLAAKYLERYPDGVFAKTAQRYANGQ